MSIECIEHWYDEPENMNMKAWNDALLRNLEQVFKTRFEFNTIDDDSARNLLISIP